MAVAVASGSSSVVSGSTTTINITGLGFDPQWVRLWHRGASGSGTGTGELTWSIGFSDGTRHACVGVGVSDNVTSTAARITFRDTLALAEWTAGGSLTGSLTVTLQTGGFDIVIPDAFTNTTTVYWECGGGHTNAYLHIGQLPSATGTFDVTTVGFQPDAALTLFAGTATANGSSTHAPASIGWTDGTNQACLGWRSSHGVALNYTWGMVNTSHVFMRAASSSVESSAAFSAWLSNGFRFDKDVGAGFQERYAVLCLKGGSFLATTTTAQTGATGTFSVTCTGITPVGVFGIANTEATATEASPSESYNAAFGWLDGSGQHTLILHDFNNETLNPSVTEEYSLSATDKFMAHYTRTSANTFTAQGVITASSLSADTVTLNQTDADTVAGLIPLFIIGNAASADTYSGRGIGRGISRGVMR